MPFRFSKIVLVVVCLCCTSFARAQQAPLMGSQDTPEIPLVDNGEVQSKNEEGVYRILVIGDGLAGGLGAGMMRMAEANPHYEILNRFNEASGLARVAFYDWPNAVAKITTDKHVDAIVVLVGLNDRQEVRNGNARYPFKSPEWIKGYTANVDRLLQASSAAGAKMFWVSIPPMADQGFDTDMQFLNSLHRERVAVAQGNYLDIRSFFSTPDGQFIDRGADETGVERKLRSRDGVTFFKQGNNRFGQLVLAAIHADEEQNSTADRLTPDLPAVEAQQTPVSGADVMQSPDNVAPSFGQEGLDGGEIAFRADAVVRKIEPAPNNEAQAVQVGSRPVKNSVAAKTGSAAEVLMVQGLSGVVPSGRFDDFSVPALP